MKTILRIVGLLVILNSALIYMHYSKLADARESTEKESWYNQEIEVINRTDALFIRHHFHNLDGARYEVVLPAESRNRACYLETDSSCMRINENVSAILEGEQNRQSISYEIPKTETSGNSKLFREPFASLRNAKPSSTILHITDESGVGGMWISGLDLVGSKSMEMVDYSMYKGKGRVSDLYWKRKVSPQVYQGDQLTIYGESIDLNVAEQLNSSLLELNARHMDIVIDSESKPLETSRIIITNNSALGLSDLVLDRGVRSLYAISEKDKLVSGLLASIFMDRPSGTNKSKGLYETLVSSMTTDQFETLKKLLAEKQGEHLDAATLDKLIGKVFGLKTSFVEKNKEGNYPFLLEDTRTTYLNGKAQEDIQVVVMDKEALYPADKILGRSGYSFSTNESSIYIENDSLKFRFSLRDPFYVLNDKRYELREKPYAIIGNEYYFEEDALRRLFQLSVQKNEESIVVKSLLGGK